MIWTDLTFRGEPFSLGDEVVVKVAPDGAEFRGFLNVIERGYIVLAGAGTQNGFPMDAIVLMWYAS